LACFDHEAIIGAQTGATVGSAHKLVELAAWQQVIMAARFTPALTVRWGASSHLPFLQIPVRLNSIKLSGFKSFAEPTNFLLPGQLVGVVGPNGVGVAWRVDAGRDFQRHHHAQAGQPRQRRAGV
jgi:hypothetical protein